MPLFSQPEGDVIPPDYIRTVQLFNPVTQNQSPFIGSQEYFILSFDDLKSSYNRYNYYIKHYNRNWEESNLFDSEITEGYFNDDIRNYKPSYNTYQTYVHYELIFPNERMRPKISGNFRLFVYTTDKNKPLFSVRFSVFEDQVLIGVMKDVLNQNTEQPNQRVQITVQSQNEFNVNSYSNGMSATIVKNNDWFESIQNIKPQFIYNNRLEFKQLDLCFYGGNEYYWWDTKNTQVVSNTTQKAFEDNDGYHVRLYPNTFQPEIFDYNPDINGAFYVRRNDLGYERISANEGDYIRMYFTLLSPELKGKKVYVVGAFNNYLRSPENEMKFHPEGFYETSLYLKQGYYNYQFVAEDSQGNLDFTLNGNFWQTENLYTALLYYRGFSDTYDRLIGLGEK